MESKRRVDKPIQFSTREYIYVDSKYAFWGTVVGALITGAIGLYIHSDGEKKRAVEEDTKVETVTTSEDPSKKNASLNILNVYVPPINTSLDSAFFAQIQNSSFYAANNVKVRLNFGESSVSTCETLPNNLFVDETLIEKTIITLSPGDILQNDSLYIYCLISHPIFESILVTGDNLWKNSTYSYKQHKKEPVRENRGSAYASFFKFLASAIAFVFIVYFSIVAIMFIDRWLDSKK